MTGTPGTGKAPVSDGAGAFPLTDIATQAELNAEASSRASADTTESTARAAADALLAPKTRALTAGAGLTGGGDLSADRTFDVQVDGFTLEIAADTVRVKDGGVTVAKLSFDPATQAELDAEAAARAAADTAAIASAEAYSDAALAAHTGDTSDAHDASAISVADAGNLIAATDVEGALEELAGSVGSIPTVAAATHAASSKATPVDADEIPLADSAASFALKKLTWANLKATIKAYTDTLYPSGSGTSTGTNTGDQTSVTGNAGTATKLATARNIDGQAFDGSADVTVIAPGTHAATSKTTPVNADEFPIVDSAASNVLKKVTFTNLKAFLKTYFDTLYPSGSGTSTGTNTGDQTSVTGNAGTATALQNARTIDGQSFDGTANITVIAPGTHAATGKTTPVDADELPLVDSAASNVLKKLTWANLKATLKTYFDTLYAPASAFTTPVWGQISRVNGSDYTTSSSSFSDVDATNLKHVISPSGRHVQVTVGASVESSAGGGGVIIGVNDGTNDYIVCASILGTGGGQYPMSGSLILPNTYSGSTTFKLRFKIAGGTTGKIRNTTSPYDNITFGIQELMV